MPVEVSNGYELGWRRNDPSDLILVVRFTDTETGKVLFKYAPKYEDMYIWQHIWEELIDYEYEKLQARVDALKKPVCKDKGRNVVHLPDGNYHTGIDTAGR